MSRDFEGIVVLGSPRSGTTLLRRLLDAHPSIVCPPETNLLYSAARFLEESDFSGGLSVGAVPGLGFSDFSEDEVLARFREFLFSFWRDILEKSGKDIWAEKTAVDVFHVEAIERLCADRCRYICITRHALDVVCSMKDLSSKMDAYLPEIHEFVKRHTSMSEAFAHAWCDANQGMIDFIDRHPNWCIQLQYEDLVKNPEIEMNRIFEFLELDANAGKFLEQALNSKKPAGLGDWRTYEKATVSTQQIGRHSSLDGWTIQKLAPVVNPLLERLGYSKVTVTQQDKQRAQEFARMIAAMNLNKSNTPDKDA